MNCIRCNKPIDRALLTEDGPICLECRERAKERETLIEVSSIPRVIDLLISTLEFAIMELREWNPDSEAANHIESVVKIVRDSEEEVQS